MLMLSIGTNAIRVTTNLRPVALGSRPGGRGGRGGRVVEQRRAVGGGEGARLEQLAQHRLQRHVRPLHLHAHAAARPAAAAAAERQARREQRAARLHTHVKRVKAARMLHAMRGPRQALGKARLAVQLRVARAQQEGGQLVPAI